MAAPSVLQVASAATTTSSPTSLTVTLSATQAGSSLLALFTDHDSGSPTVNFPGGWNNTAGYFAQSNMRHRLYYLAPSLNPGGITSVALTLSGVDSAACIIYEVANLQATPNNQSPQEFSGGNASTGSTSPTSQTTTPTNIDELWIGTLCYLLPATVTANLAPPSGTWTAAPSATSTTGTTNIGLAGWYALPGTALPSLTVAGTLSQSQAWSCTLLSFRSGSSAPSVLTNVNGNAGQLTGSFFQGMIGG